MLSLAPAQRIYLAVEPVDMRKQFNPSSSVRRTSSLPRNVLRNLCGDFRHYIRDDTRALGQA